MIQLADPMADVPESGVPESGVPESGVPESDAPGTTVTSAVAALIDCQRQLADVVEKLTDEQYVQKPVGAVTSSVGGHVRHCLDHVAALVAGARLGWVDYDARQRGTAIETSRQAALEGMKRLEQALRAWGWQHLRRPLRLKALVHPAIPAIHVSTSVGRELAFVLNHTVHHCALIAVMAQIMGVAVPERFGYAPATRAYLEQRPCAR